MNERARKIFLAVLDLPIVEIQELVKELQKYLNDLSETEEE